MEPEKEVKFFDLLREFSRRSIRYLITGRRAVILYGAPVLTADHDLWIHPEDREKALNLLSDELGFKLSQPPSTKKTRVTGFSGAKKYDLFFQRGIRNIENDRVEFEQCLRNSTVKKDPKEDVQFRIPSIDDLIRLKKIRRPNVKDEQDIQYLLKAKQLLKKSR
jgi:hypothetical protein